MVLFHRHRIIKKSAQIILLIVIIFSFIGVCVAGQEKLDPLAVEQTLKAWFIVDASKDFVKMVGIHMNSETTATAYFVIKVSGKVTDARANILYFIDKGWFINKPEYGYDFDRKWWDGIFLKVKMKQ